LREISNYFQFPIAATFPDNMSSINSLKSPFIMGRQTFLQKNNLSGSKWLPSFVGLILLCTHIFLTNLAYGQGTSEKEFHAAATLITQKTANSYQLLRLGNNKVPAMLTCNRSHAKLPENERNSEVSVRNFAQTEAKYIATNVLGLSENAQLEESGTQKTSNLWLSSFTLSYNDIPLRERFLRINIGALSGEIMLVRNNIPSKTPNSLSPIISEEIALLKTKNLLGIHSEIKSAPQLVFIDEKENSFLRLSFEIIAKDPDMFEMWRLTYDALSGELIEKKSLVEHDCFGGSFSEDNILSHTYKTVQANAFDANENIPQNSESQISGKVLAKVHLQCPYDTATVVGLPYVRLSINGISVETDSNGIWSLPSISYPLSIESSFDSRFFSVLRQDGKANSILKKAVLAGTTNILWDDSNSDPAERDAYYSAAIAHLADKRIDKNLNGIDLHMKVNVNLNASCNAYYIPNDTSINFFKSGSECSNSAEVADVVYHEYGHRVTHARYSMASKKNTNIIDGSLSEGFADLNSAFIRDDPRIGIGFFGDPKTTDKILRNCENNKKWPKDISPDIHISGEIISGAFWDLRKMIGLDAARHLFHFMEYQMPDGAGITDSASLEDAFSSTLSAVILTDDDDNDLSNGTPHEKEILAAFKLHNITLARFVDLETRQIEDQDSSSESYEVTLKASYRGIVGGLNKESVKIFYSTDNGKNYQPITLTSEDEDEYEGLIPKVPSGSVVYYYASALTKENDTVNFPSISLPYSFLVGFKRIVIDDAETDKGWSLASSGDNATTGLWIRGKPNGTLTDATPPLVYVQQDTDHTKGGKACYITGNRIDPSGTNSVGYDDVDNGITTLTTPAFDLSTLRSPYIRYWYFYSNDQGQNSGLPIWKTEVSNDNGQNWVQLQSTNQSTNGSSGFPEWREYSFRLNDYVKSSASVVLRFIANDNIGALVEAGVDDLEILDPLQPEAGVTPGSDISSIPYPNPIGRGMKMFIPNLSPITLIDLLGRTVISIIPSGNELTIPLNILPGIYYFEQPAKRFKIVIY
jgi:hypothetical protein